MEIYIHIISTDSLQRHIQVTLNEHNERYNEHITNTLLAKFMKVRLIFESEAHLGTF